MLTGTETILLVEDEASVRVLVRRVLEGYGYTVIEAEGGSAAADVGVRFSGPIHLLLTDIALPDGSGAKVAAELRRLRPSIAVVFMSGDIDKEAAKSDGHETDGDSHFLQKPFSVEELARTVGQALSVRRGPMM